MQRFFFLLISTLALITSAVRIPIINRRDPPLDCPNIIGIDNSPSGQACYDPYSGVPICAAVQCEGLPGKPMPGDDGMGDCAQCSCANSGSCSAACDPGLLAPNGQPCSSMCTTCLCNTMSCGLTGTSNQGGGPLPAGLGGEA